MGKNGNPQKNRNSLKDYFQWKYYKKEETVFINYVRVILLILLIEFYQLACYEYEKALTVFAYIDCKKMKINEIRDEDLIYRNYDYLHPQEKSKLEEISLHIYLNLSICYMKLEMFKDSIYACDYALKIDPKSIKAFYRRAQVRLDLNDYPNIGKINE